MCAESDLGSHSRFTMYCVTLDMILTLSKTRAISVHNRIQYEWCPWGYAVQPTC